MPKGIKGFQKGYVPTEEQRRKIKEARLKRKEKLGYLNSPETREKIKLATRGKKRQPLSEERKEKMRKAMSGDKNPMKKLENRKKLSDAQKGSKNHFWQGGISFEPYTTDWTETLRRAIRERDNYICQLCSQYGNVVHHKNYDKKNCNLDNLITLCRKCHIKTNFNRNYWIKSFKNL